MDNSHYEVFAVILAGGSGTRFWPKSRHLSPKQLCRIGDQELTMIELTLNRLDGFIPKEKRIIITHQDQAPQTIALTKNACSRVISEPMSKNTAPALALAALEIEKLCPDKKSIMISLHADAIIRNEPGFIESLKDAIEIAKKGYLSLIGVPPTSPETGYGYIESGEALEKAPGFLVSSFREKPDSSTAEKYLQDPRFYWNSGIFTWDTEVFLGELKENVPKIEKMLSHAIENHDSFTNVPNEQLKEAYASLPKISVDNAILETSQKVAMTRAHFDWQDIGSWDSLQKSFPVDKDGNCIQGKTLVLECKSSVIDSDGPLIACLGMEDTVVIAAKGAILVCPTKRAQEVKKIVESLESNDLAMYL